MRPYERHVKTALVAGFLCLISLPSVDLLFHIDRTRLGDENANVRSVSLAVTDLASLRTFPGRARLFLQNTFGFRGLLVRAHGLLAVRVFGVSSAHAVLLGQKGFLFLTTEGSLDGYLRTSPFSRAELAKWRDVLAERKTWLGERGTDFVFLVAPDKHTLYSEYMPAYLHEGKGPSRMDQLVHAAPDLVLDVRPALREAMATERTYHLTDTHWNEVGGLVASTAIARELSRRRPGLPPLGLDDALLTKVVLPGGDLARLLGLKYDYREEAWAVSFPSTLARFSDGTPITNEGIDVQSQATVRTTNPRAPLGKALVFRDSFGDMMKRPVAELFRETVFVWTDDFDPDLVRKEQPNVVIEELVERRLMTLTPEHVTLAEPLVADVARAR